jgi:hypothetical protein
VIAIIDHTEEIKTDENDTPYLAHLKQHPGMESFMLSSDCAIIRITAQTHHLIYGVDTRGWITTAKLNFI